MYNYHRTADDLQRNDSERINTHALIKSYKYPGISCRNILNIQTDYNLLSCFITPNAHKYLPLHNKLIQIISTYRNSSSVIQKKRPIECIQFSALL